MHLDARKRDGGDRISKRDGRVRERAWIDKQSLNVPASLVNPIEQFPLVVRLSTFDACGERAAEIDQRFIDLF